MMLVLHDRQTWPNLTEAATLIGVNVGTLSKRAREGKVQYETLGLGHGRLILPPEEVVRIGRAYQRVNDLALLDALARLLLHKAQARGHTVQGAEIAAAVRALAAEVPPAAPNLPPGRFASPDDRHGRIIPLQLITEGIGDDETLWQVPW